MADVDDIIWEEPPPKAGSIHPDVIAALRNNPGEWARIKDKLRKHPSVTHFNKCYPDIEFTTRRVDGIVRLYARAREDDEKAPTVTRRKRGLSNAVLDVIQDAEDMGATPQEITEMLEREAWTGTAKTSLLQRVRTTLTALKDKGLVVKGDEGWVLAKHKPNGEQDAEELGRIARAEIARQRGEPAQL